MEHFIFICTFVSLLTLNLRFVVSESQLVESSLPKTQRYEVLQQNSTNILTFDDIRLLNSSISSKKTQQPSKQLQLDNNENTSSSSKEVNLVHLEDTESSQLSKETESDDSTSSPDVGVSNLPQVTAELKNIVNKGSSINIEEDESYSKDDEEDIVSTEEDRNANSSLPSWLILLKNMKKEHKSKDNLFDLEEADTEGDYYEGDSKEDSREDSEVDKKDDTDYEDENDEEEKDNDFDEVKNEKNDEAVNGLLKKNKPIAVPTSMVLFYTWMIIVVLIIIVGFSTYQTHCRGIKFLWTKVVASPKDDHKKLMENEFV